MGMLTDAEIASALFDEVARLRKENEKLRHALVWSRSILANMALEFTTGWRSIFARWPIHHEPLRSDARGVLPIIDAALGASAGEARQGQDLGLDPKDDHATRRGTPSDPLPQGRRSS